MESFKPSLTVTANGIASIGRSPSKSLSILSSGVTGTLGIFLDGTFYPHEDGLIAAGQMFTFDVGVGREVGISVTGGTGVISSAAV